MIEFKFRIITVDGTSLTYSVSAKEKLEALARVKETFPSSKIQLVGTVITGKDSGEETGQELNEARPKIGTMSDERAIEFLEQLHKEQMIWFVLGSLISADSLMEETNYRENLEILLQFEKVLDKAQINEPGMKGRIGHFITKAIRLIKQEYKETYGKDL